MHIKKTTLFMAGLAIFIAQIVQAQSIRNFSPKDLFQRPSPTEIFSLEISKMDPIHIFNKSIVETLLFNGSLLDTQSVKKLTFSKSEFRHIAVFSGSFKNEWRIQSDQTLFNSGLSFLSSTFDTRVVLSKSAFSGIHFYNTTFNKGLEIKETYIKDKLNLVNTILRDSVFFSNSEFENGLISDGAILPQYLDFSEVKSIHIIDLSKTLLDSVMIINGDKCHINLFDAPLNKMKFSYENFKLFIPEVTDIVVFEKSNRLYEQVLQKFRDNGQSSSYEKLDKEYKAFKFISDPNDKFKLAGKALNFINREWNDYGYAKSRIWRHTLVFFIIFLVINRIRLEHLNHKVYPINAIIKEINAEKSIKWYQKYPILNPKLLSQSIFYTALVFFGLKISIENLKFNSNRGVFYILFQYVVGLICVAYLANFVISSQLIGG